MISKSLLLLFFISFGYGENTFLESVGEEELLSLIRNEKFVIVLFTKPDCPTCDKLESMLINMREDLVDTLNAWVVKAEGSYLVKIYNPSKEPSLVFFRHGVPLLYDGELNEEMIYHEFTDNKDPVVRELSDHTFELLTQAATGATTGDWFIMFYSDDCVDCLRLQARWEAVGAKLKTRLNVAQLNIKTSAVTARRFRISTAPTFLFFRLGKMYYYNFPKTDVPSFVTFASSWYKNAKSEKVPLPKAPFDDFIQQIVDALQETSGMAIVFVAFVLVGILIHRYISMKTKTEKKPPKKWHDKKEKTLKKEPKPEKLEKEN